MDRGEGQHWNLAPGNLYSTPRKVDLDPARKETISISLENVIPPLPDPPTTKWVKHERIRSERLSRFWGRDMYLGAHVLLPLGFDEHPEARYPFVIFHGHFPETIGGFREEPPDPNLKPNYDERFHLAGYNRIVQEQACAVLLGAASVLQGLDVPASPCDRGRNPAREPLLRRLVRGELRERRPVRRRDRVRAHPLPREEIPGDRRGLGALRLRRLDGRLGGDGRPGLLSRRLQRGVDRVSRSDRLPGVHGRQHLRRPERLSPRRAVEDDAATGHAQLSRTHLGDAGGDEQVRTRARHERPVGRPVGHLAGRLLARGRGRISEADLGQDDRRHRQGGRGVLEGKEVAAYWKSTST